MRQLLGKCIHWLAVGTGAQEIVLSAGPVPGPPLRSVAPSPHPTPIPPYGGTWVSGDCPGPLLLPSSDSIILCSLLAEIPSGVWNLKRGSLSSGLKR